MKKKHILPISATLCAAAFFIFVCSYFYADYTRLGSQVRAMCDQADAAARKSAELEEQITHLNLYIDHLLKDAEFREMEARSHAGMASEGEVIIREDRNGGGR